ncbi:MAG: hypothetical protein PHY45_17260 [Rhodocyclaceae bacterium]|nr:hypothetical protein [Rhodocyclaceae bacterium]
MTIATDDFRRRIGALVSALGLLQRSQPDSVGYAEFRGKLEKCVRLVLATADGLLRQLPSIGDAGDAAAALPASEVLRQAHEHGVLSAAESTRWCGYFERLLPGDGAVYGEETLDRLRAFLLDARSLEATLRRT